MNTSSFVITGQLDAFCETGTEGVVWSVTWSGVPGYDALFTLRGGDELLVYGAGGQEAWRGVINLECERRWRSYPGNPQHGQQEVLGFWVHGLQRDVDPETWASLFFRAAPAVARLQRVDETFRDVPALEAALDGLSASPVAAIARLREDAPGTAQRVLSGLPYRWRYFCERLGWPVGVLKTPEDLARAWRLILAGQRAERALWECDGAQAEMALKGRWPTPGHATEREVRQWLAHRLPADGVFDVL